MCIVCSFCCNIGYTAVLWELFVTPTAFPDSSHQRKWTGFLAHLNLFPFSHILVHGVGGGAQAKDCTRHENTQFFSEITKTNTLTNSKKCGTLSPSDVYNAACYVHVNVIG